MGILWRVAKYLSYIEEARCLKVKYVISFCPCSEVWAGVGGIKICKDGLYIGLSRVVDGPPLWSSGQSFWLQIQRSRVRFPALPDFLSGSGSGTGSTQPREVN